MESRLFRTAPAGPSQVERWFASALEQVSQSDFFTAAPIGNDRGALWFDEMAAELADSKRAEDSGTTM